MPAEDHSGVAFPKKLQQADDVRKDGFPRYREHVSADLPVRCNRWCEEWKLLSSFYRAEVFLLSGCFGRAIWQPMDFDLLIDQEREQGGKSCVSES